MFAQARMTRTWLQVALFIASMCSLIASGYASAWLTALALFGGMRGVDYLTSPAVFFPADQVPVYNKFVWLMRARSRGWNDVFSYGDWSPLRQFEQMVLLQREHALLLHLGTLIMLCLAFIVSTRLHARCFGFVGDAALKQSDNLPSILTIARSTKLSVRVSMVISSAFVLLIFFVISISSAFMLESFMKCIRADAIRHDLVVATGIALVGSASAFVLASRNVAAVHRRLSPRCSSCGYSGVRIAYKCSECGTANTKRHSAIRYVSLKLCRCARRRWWIGAIVLFTCTFGVMLFQFHIEEGVRRFRHSRENGAVSTTDAIANDIDGLRWAPDFLVEIHESVQYDATMNGNRFSFLVGHTVDKQFLHFLLKIPNTVDNIEYKFPIWNPRLDEYSPRFVPIIKLFGGTIHIVPEGDIMIDPGRYRIDLRIYADEVRVNPST